MSGRLLRLVSGVKGQARRADSLSPGWRTRASTMARRGDKNSTLRRRQAVERRESNCMRACSRVRLRRQDSVDPLTGRAKFEAALQLGLGLRSPGRCCGQHQWHGCPGQYYGGLEASEHQRGVPISSLPHELAPRVLCPLHLRNWRRSHRCLSVGSWAAAVLPWSTALR
jgi:hypothetical protein